jgi:hypothetical protein
MPLKLTLYADIVIPEDIISKKEFLEFFKNNREALVSFIDEDINELFQTFETIDDFLENFEWIKDKDICKYIQTDIDKKVH